MDNKNIILHRGEVAISTQDILQTNISSCVSICFYHPHHRVGGMTHIANSLENDTTPSGKYIKKDGYFYTEKAIDGIMKLLSKNYNIYFEKKIQIVLVGGLANEGPIRESLDILHNHEFELVGMDIMQNLFRNVIFDTSQGHITVYRKPPFSDHKSIREFNFLQ